MCVCVSLAQLRCIIDYVHGIGNRNDSAHVTIKIMKIIPVLTVRSLRKESVAV